MKKFFTLVIAIFLGGIMMNISAQNRVENPGFETWNGDEPTPWTTTGGGITLSQETTTIHGGSNACKVVFTSQSNQNLKSNTFAVTPGETLAGSVWVLDNDEAGKARISLLFEGASNYYGGYSEDNLDWQELTFEEVVPEGATAATFQVRFYDVNASWDGDAEIFVDDVACTTNSAIHPEPSNYPTAFAANADRLNIDLSWADATGSQLPSGYLILGSTSDNISAPVDGTAVDNDTDISDGSFAINVNMGEEHCFVGMQNGVTVNQNYYFKIYPYTNSGDDIDYKTDGNAPESNASTPNTAVVLASTFATDLEDWTAVSVMGDEQVWAQESYQDYTYAAMSGYAGGSVPNEDWLISPDMTIYNKHADLALELSFRSAYKHDGPALELYYSTDYTSGNPNTATWTPLSATWSDGNYHWVASGNIDLPHEAGLRIAFKYTSTDTQSSKWEVTDILVTGTEDISNPATQLDITDINGGEPVYTNQGFSIEVASLNADGNLANVDTDVVVNIAVKTGTGNLMGTTTDTIHNGANAVAIDGLLYDTAENGVVLEVSDAAGNLTAGDSDAFDVIEIIYAPLVITEIMYNPPESGNDSLEYIELYNNSTEAVGPEGYVFSQGIDYVFPAMSIAPNSYLVIAKDSAALQRQLGIAARQWTDGGLKNSGEAIVITAPDGTLIDSVYYDDAEPWPVLGDGHGPSIAICDPSTDNSDPANWHASTHFLTTNSNNDSIFGSPGMAPAPVADFTSDIQNINTSQEVNFSENCSCNATSFEWVFEGGTPATSSEANPAVTYNAAGIYDVTLTATNATGSHTIVMEDYITVTDGVIPATQLDITDVNGGATVYINQPFSVQIKSLDADGNLANVDADVVVNIVVKTGTGTLMGTTTDTIHNGANAVAIDGLLYDTAENGVVLEVSDAAGNLTAGDSDAFDVIEIIYAPLVITEIMYNPPESGNDSLEYIELYNNSTEAVGPEGYVFSQGIDYVFPAMSIAPNSYLVIAKDSAALQRQLGIAARQWTDGGLKNSGEAIVITAPDGTLIDSVYYDDAEPWPVLGDGHGPSIAICDPSTDNSDPANWHASTHFLTTNSNNDSIFGSPGMAPAPVADFTSDIQIINSGQEVNFSENCSCNATSFEWVFEGGIPATSTEANPTVIYNTEGTYDVTLTATNATGSHTIVMEGYISVTDGLEDFALANISVSPNPSHTGFFTIRNKQQQQINIQVYDMMGKSIVQDFSTYTDAQIDLSAQKSGVYFLQLTTTQHKRTVKIIKD